MDNERSHSATVCEDRPLRDMAAHGPRSRIRCHAGNSHRSRQSGNFDSCQPFVGDLVGGTANCLLNQPTYHSCARSAV